MVIDPKNLIVCYKHKQTAVQKAFGVVLPILFWCALLYILSTLFVLGSWIIDYSRFENVIGYQDIFAIKTVISRFFPVIGGCVCVFLLWALYNKLRFQGSRNRRTTRPAPVTLEETAGFCRLDTTEIKDMQRAKVMTCMFDDKGNIVGVRQNVIVPAEKRERYGERYVNISVMTDDAVLNEKIAA